MLPEGRFRDLQGLTSNPQTIIIIILITNAKKKKLSIPFSVNHSSHEINIFSNSLNLFRKHIGLNIMNCERWFFLKILDVSYVFNVLIFLHILTSIVKNCTRN